MLTSHTQRHTPWTHPNRSRPVAKHIPTVLAEASLNLHRAHHDERAFRARLENAEQQAKQELVDEGAALTVRNVAARKWQIANRT